MKIKIAMCFSSVIIFSKSRWLDYHIFDKQNKKKRRPNNVDSVSSTWAPGSRWLRWQSSQWIVVSSWWSSFDLSSWFHDCGEKYCSRDTNVFARTQQHGLLHGIESWWYEACFRTGALMMFVVVVVVVVVVAVVVVLCVDARAVISFCCCVCSACFFLFLLRNVSCWPLSSLLSPTTLVDPTTTLASLPIVSSHRSHTWVS